MLSPGRSGIGIATPSREALMSLEEIEQLVLEHSRRLVQHQGRQLGSCSFPPEGLRNTVA